MNDDNKAHSCLPLFQQWVWEFKKDRLLSSVGTTNGIERQNKSFKYEYLGEIGV